MAQKKNLKIKTKSKSNKIDTSKIQNWILNIVIVSFSIIIISFMISSTKRFNSNSKNIAINQINTFQKLPQYSHIAIEILNGSGINGMATKYTDFLRLKGFDVISTGNADRMDFLETIIYTNDTTETTLMPVLGIMDFTKDKIEFTKSLRPGTDIQIILGKDCNRLAIFEKIKKMERNF